jgi:DNA-binding beta-propeller fold protein YncE
VRRRVRTGSIVTGRRATRTGALATVAAIIASLVVSAGFVAGAPPATSATSTTTLTGTVSSTGTVFVGRTFVTAVPGTITVTLDWDQPSARVNLFLYDPTNALVAMDTTTAKPKTVTFNATTFGTWRVGAKAISGPSTNFTAVVQYPVSSLTSVGDFVWVDKNLNGVQDPGESGAAGVSIEAHDATTNALLATTTSDASGHYGFTGLPAAIPLYIQVAAPAGSAFTTLHAGTNPTLDSDVDPATARTAPFVLVPGVPNNDIDIGLAPTAQTFTGTIGPSPNDFQQYFLPVWSSGTLDVTLSWSTSTTNLNLFVYNPAGTIAASATGNGFPEHLTLTGTPGVWKFAAKWISGATVPFTLAVSVPAGTPAAVKVSQYGFNGHAGLYGYGIDWNPATNELLVADVWNHRILHYNATTGASLGVFATSPPGGVMDPFDVEVASDGSVWVADQGLFRVIVYNPNGTWRETIGWNGGPQPWQSYPKTCVGNGAMNQPTHIAEEPGTGLMYVSDVICGTISVFTPDGHFVRGWQVQPPGLGAGAQGVPRGLDFDSAGNLYVAEFRTKSVLVYNDTGTLLRQFAPDPTLRDVRGLVVDRPRNLVYAVDAGGEGVHEWRTDGTFLRTFTQWGSTPFNTIRFITVDASGNVYVSDMYGYRLYAFDVNLNPLWATPPLPPPDGGMNNGNAVSIDPISGKLFAVDTFENRIQRFSPTDSGGNVLSCTSATSCPAFDLAFGYRGFTGNTGAAAGLNYPREVVSDGYSVWTDGGHTISQFTVDGQFVTRWNRTSGPLPGEFAVNITGLVARPTPGTNGTQGKLYTVDQGNCRIQVFDYQGNLLDYMGSCGSGTDQMNNPRQLSIDFATNRAYVADIFNNRIAVWDLTTHHIVQTYSMFAGQSLIQPVGVALDPTGTWVYVADTNRDRIVRIHPDGSGAENVTLGQDLPGGQFSQPEYLAFDAQGQLYVDDVTSVWSFRIIR